MIGPVSPLRYRLRIVPHLERFLFDGWVEIELNAAEESRLVQLNAHQLAVWQCLLLGDDEEQLCDFALKPREQLLSIELPMTVSGAFTLRIEYQGRINDEMAGFYRSRFNKEGQERFVAVTQFQESDARRAFPCMDHPAYKAIFEVQLTAPADLTVLANTEPLREEILADGRKRIDFAPTPHMSTYLLFFGVGEFQMAQDPQDARVRVAHLPGLDHTTGPGSAYGREALHFCEEYFAIPYPLSKLDLIAVPDFAFGAMENWGAITFRENLLLHFAEHTSTAATQRISEIIAHEIVHQWFGNLVTPADWKYLWLNESFATYFAYGVVAHHHPDWRIWDQFLHDETATALMRDGLIENFAIEIPGDRAMAINVSTAPIIYNKGASILRMIEGHIGAQSYRQGVQGYLAKHRYACAESHDLWDAFETASALPIIAMMQSWIGQPGHPLVTARRTGRTLTLHQERFTYLPQPSDQRWLIPLRIRLWNSHGETSETALIMQNEMHVIELPEGTAAYKLNIEQTGFYRCAYEDQHNCDALGGLIERGAMPTIDRWGVQNDLYALLRQGRLALDAFLAFLAFYKNETAYLPLTGIADHLQQLFLLAPSTARPTIAAAGRRLAEQVLERIGMTPAQGEPQATALLRDQLLWLAVLWNSSRALDFCADQFADLVAGRAVHPDIARSVVQAGAYTRGGAALPWLCDRFSTSPSEHERINILAAFAAFQKWEPTAEALAYVLAKVPQRNRFMPIVAAAYNPLINDRLWEWYQTNLAAVERLHPILYERVIAGLWPYAGLFQGEIQVNGFARRYLQKHPGLTEAVRLALENLAVNRNVRTRLGER